jgi:ubiquinone biosynthesis protein
VEHRQPFLERWMRERVSPKPLGNLQSQVEQLPHLANMTRDLLERLSQPHANDPPPPWHRARTTGSCACSVPRIWRAARSRRRRAVEPAGPWPAGIMLAVGFI